LQTTPIFDTNVFGDIQRALISQADWKYLLRHRPRYGWPLSSVTALELLVGVDAALPQDFLHVRERIALAYHLSHGRILEDPRSLLCKELLHIPFPSDQLPPFSPTVSRYMDVIRRAASSEQLLNTGVPYKGRKARINTTSVLTGVMAGPKKAWMTAVEQMADETYPAWRQLVQQTGKRLPFEMRKELEPRSAWQMKRPGFITALLDWLGASSRPEVVAEMSARLDAVLEFTIFVAREFLLRNYSLEKHQSDVFDQFQLQYLAFDRFVIVTGDPDLSTRTQRSSQNPRIMSFEQFLQTI
jgi:hypothetical protein